MSAFSRVSRGWVDDATQWRPLPGGLISWNDIGGIVATDPVVAGDGTITHAAVDAAGITDGFQEGVLGTCTLTALEDYLDVPAGGLSGRGGYGLLVRITPPASDDDAEVLVGVGLVNNTGATAAGVVVGVNSDGATDHLLTNVFATSVTTVPDDVDEVIALFLPRDGVSSGFLIQCLVGADSVAGGIEHLNVNAVGADGAYLGVHVGVTAAVGGTVTLGSGYRVELAALDLRPSWGD